MSLPDLADAVEESGLHLDVVDFDACLMAMYEVAFEFAGVADYMVFSQEVEPDDGDPYDVILEKLVEDPDMTPAQLAELVATEYAEFYRSLKTSVVTKSAVDMSRVPALHESLCDLARTLNENMNTERAAIQAARDESLRFDFPENHDLGDFLNLLAGKTQHDTILSKIETAREALEWAVIRNEAYSPAPVADIDRAEGLAIFLPRRGEATDMDLADYSLLAINRNRGKETATWGNFVNMLVTGDGTLPSDPLAKVPGNFSIWLTWDTDADLDLIIREPGGDYAAPYHGTNSDNGFLSQDSYLSGESSEYYNAAETVDPGVYEIFVNYFRDGENAAEAQASVYFMDSVNGVDEYALVGSRRMGLSNPAPVFWMDDPELSEEVENDVYSDWWLPGGGDAQVVRCSGESADPDFAGVSSFTFPLKAKTK